MRNTEMKWLCLQLCLFVVSSKAVEGCKTSSLCYAGKICSHYKCVPAARCDRDDDCKAEGTCVSGYCQESVCSENGQCVHGQKCSSSGKCIYPVIISAAESTDITLKSSRFTNDCEETKWFKYKESNSYLRLAALKEDKSLWYYGEFCSHSCLSSPKLKLDTVKGDLAIHDLQLSDEDDYYYYCLISDELPKYELVRLDVYVEPTEETVKISGVAEAIEEGTEVHITCLVNRIKPKALDMYWVLNGKRINEEIKSIDNYDGKTYRHVINLKYTFREKDHGTSLYCVVESVHGRKVSQRKAVNVLYAPVGKPRIVPSHLSKIENEQVEFKCEARGSVNSNPNCQRYIWTKVRSKNDADEGTFPKVVDGSDLLKLKMERRHEGKYQCQCKNQYGKSEVSDVAVLWFHNITSAILPTEADMSITGLPEVIKAGDMVELTCTMHNIKPEAFDMYWIINGRRIHGSVHTILNQDATSLIQHNKLFYLVREEDYDSSVQCVLLPPHGKSLILSETLNGPYQTSLRKDHSNSGFFVLDSANGGPGITIIAGTLAFITLSVLCAVFTKSFKSKYGKKEESVAQPSLVFAGPTGETSVENQNAANEDLIRPLPNVHHYEYITEEPSSDDHLLPVTQREHIPYVVYDCVLPSDSYRQTSPQANSSNFRNKYDESGYLVPTKNVTEIRQVYHSTRPPSIVRPSTEQPTVYMTMTL